MVTNQREIVTCLVCKLWLFLSAKTEKYTDRSEDLGNGHPLAKAKIPEVIIPVQVGSWFNGGVQITPVYPSLGS